MPIYQYDELREKHNKKPYDYETILCEVDPPIGRIILNQPEKRNPLSYERIYELAQAAKEMEMDEDVKVIILKGAGPCFSAGHDLTPHAPIVIHPDRDKIWNSMYRERLRVDYTLWELQKPVIAQIHGYCLAGAHILATFCDIRFLADNAVIGWPMVRAQVTEGIIWEPWIMGMTKAKELLFTGDSMDAQEAFRVGWATRVYPLDKLEEETEKFAQRVALIETDLLMMTKRNINRQMDLMGFRIGIDHGIDQMVLSGFRKSSGAFKRELGVKEAIRERDGKFGDYSTTEAAKKAREKAAREKGTKR